MPRVTRESSRRPCSSPAPPSARRRRPSRSPGPWRRRPPQSRCNVPDYFPAFLDLRERPCLVVGGGAIGERKARELLACHARVTVVSPCLTAELQTLAQTDRLVWRARTFLRSDVRRCALVIAATGIPAVDTAVAAEARRRGVLVNAVDWPAQCDFIFGSILRRGELQIAVSAGPRLRPRRCSGAWPVKGRSASVWSSARARDLSTRLGMRV